MITLRLASLTLELLVVPVTISNISLDVYALKGRVGARGCGETFTSVYLDAGKIDGKPGTEFLRGPRRRLGPSGRHPVPSALAGACLQVDLRSVAATRADHAARSGRRTRLRSPIREFSSHAT